MAGIADVARAAGVSKSTASRALTGSGYVSDETRDAGAGGRGIPRLRRLDRARSASSTGRTQNVGVVMPYVNRWFFAEVLEGIQDALLERGFDLTLYDAQARHRRHARGSSSDFLARKRFDGLIAVGLEPERPRTRAARRDRQARRQRRRVEPARRRSSRSTTTTRRDARPSTCIGARPPRHRLPRRRTATHWAYVDRRAARRLPRGDDGCRARRPVAHVPSAVTHARRLRARPSTLLGDARGAPDGDRRVVRRGRDRRDHRRAAARHPGARASSASSASTTTSTPRCSRSRRSEQVPREQGAHAVELLMRRLERSRRRRPVDMLRAAPLIVRSSTAADRRGMPSVGGRCRIAARRLRRLTPRERPRSPKVRASQATRSTQSSTPAHDRGRSLAVAARCG